MNKILYYTCSHSSHDAEFWEAVRASLSTRNCSLIVATTPSNRYVEGEDRTFTSWKIDPPPRLRTLLEEKLDWNRLELCARGYGESFDRGEIISQALSLIIHLAIEQPSLLLVYNDRRRVGNLLRQLSTIYGLPCLVVERLPWPAWISVDPGGMLLECSLFREPPPSTKPTSSLPEEYERVAGRNEATWWAQPRAEAPPPLDRILPPGKKILLFVHQVDEDAQNFAYSPHFKDNAEALSWVMRSLPADGSVFVLGKHHPQSSAPASVYANILGSNGYWSTTHSMEECLARADAIVAVNSSLLFEAILTRKPVGCLGMTVLHDRGVFLQLDSLADTGFIPRLLASSAEELAERLERFRLHTGHTLERAFCLKPKVSPGYGRRGPEALSDFLAHWLPPTAPEGFDHLRRDAAESLDATLTLHTWMRRSRLVRFIWRIRSLPNRLFRRRA